MAERVDSSSADDLPELVGLSGVSNVLFLAPTLDGTAEDVCADLLTPTTAGRTNVLAITFTQTAQEWIDDWNAHAGGSPARGAVLAVGRSDAGVADPAWSAETVENPGDLTGLGIRLSDLLSDLAESAAEDERLVLCFDSATSLLQYTDLQRAFRFLHVVTGRVKTAGAVAHYHADPQAHDDQELATLKGLFDALVSVDPDGNVELRR